MVMLNRLFTNKCMKINIDVIPGLKEASCIKVPSAYKSPMTHCPFHFPLAGRKLQSPQ